MSLKVSDKGGDYENCPAGVHPAWCVSVIDLGTQNSDLYGAKKKVWIMFETPGEHMSDGRPFGVSNFYTASLNEKATLRHDLESWRGRPFTKEELADFDLKNILGKSCLINVMHNDRGRAEIAGIMPLPKGMPIPARINELMSFDVNAFDFKIFEKIPEGIQKLIKRSQEYLQDMGHSVPPSSGQPTDADIPF